MFDERTIQNLKFYVYLLVNPINEEPFYVGKGKGNRIFDHIECALEEENESDKLNEIREIKGKGHKVKHVIIRHGLNEKTAFEIESSIIDTFKYVPKLQNFVRGNIQGGINSVERGLMTVSEIKGIYNAVELTQIQPDSIIININRSYKRASGGDVIYQATKEIWGIKKSRLDTIKYVLSEYKGLVVEVYKVKHWYPKLRGYNKGAKKYGQQYTGYGFEGVVAKSEVRNLYINKKVIKKNGFGGVIIYPKTLKKLLN